MAIYGYARVSTKEQNLERQIIELHKYIDDDRYIITDKASGKNFNRRGYNSLVGTVETAPLLHEGDLLLITSLDRLGRNYSEIKEQWEFITKTLKADIKVLDIPMLDTTVSDDNLDKRFIADLVLQILSYTSEKERKNIRQRQQQGIAAMPTVNGKKVSNRTGKPTGRPAIEYPSNWAEVYAKWVTKEITATEAMRILRLKRTTYYKLLRGYTCKSPAHDKNFRN